MGKEKGKKKGQQQQLNIHAVICSTLNDFRNKGAVCSRYITLKRDDLIDWKKDTPIQEVNINDFKSTSVTRDEILKAYYILFSDGNIHKVLKDRFA